MTIEELCVVILRDGGGDDVCIEITLVAGQQGEFVLHIRDTAKYFDPLPWRQAVSARKAVLIWMPWGEGCQE